MCIICLMIKFFLLTLHVKIQRLHQFLVGFDGFKAAYIAKCNDLPSNRNRMKRLFISIFCQLCLNDTYHLIKYLFFI